MRSGERRRITRWRLPPLPLMCEAKMALRLGAALLRGAGRRLWAREAPRLCGSETASKPPPAPPSPYQERPWEYLESEAQGEAGGKPLSHLPRPQPPRALPEREAPGPVHLPSLRRHLPPHAHGRLHEAAQAPDQSHRAGAGPRAAVAPGPLRPCPSRRLLQQARGGGQDARGSRAGAGPALVPLVRAAAAASRRPRAPAPPLQGLPQGRSRPSSSGGHR
ncbi:small ribosomal subunit protein mS40 isoform X2 [Phaenicophaeus curvirostris]|uniref:small ribosomal subunit protein mS40 isoform X2 n=1 Tax=Phaenicophaeus curvirostris TaxID=33595 RepID=UPI0037F0E469